MVAHLTIAQFQPERGEDFIRTFHERILPLARSGLGYRGMYLLADRTSGKALALSLWDTADDALAYEQSAAYLQHLTAADDGLATPMQTELYEVMVQA
jgi:heme-degrading monooxygenase HmoA